MLLFIQLLVIICLVLFRDELSLLIRSFAARIAGRVPKSRRSRR